MKREIMGKQKIEGTAEAWESRKLGADEQFVKAAPSELERQLDDSLGLQMISIRLSKELIDDFKFMADFHGIGYQPLMRDTLQRFAYSEMRKIAKGLVDPQKGHSSREKAKKVA